MLGFLGFYKNLKNPDFRFTVTAENCCLSYTSNYAIICTLLQMMRQEEGSIMYDIFFVNFWIIILCPVFVRYKLKKCQKT